MQGKKSENRLKTYLRRREQLHSSLPLLLWTSAGSLLSPVFFVHFRAKDGGISDLVSIKHLALRDSLGKRFY